MLRAVDHVGITVPDLEQAVDFFVNALGCELVFRGGPYPSSGFVLPGNDGPESTVMKLAVLSRSGTHNIELLEYQIEGVDRFAEVPLPSRPGSWHLGIYTDDLQGDLERLSAIEGVQVLGHLTADTEGPSKGQQWVYLLTPWGLPFELTYWQPGMNYEKDTDRRMVHPLTVVTDPSLPVS